MPDKDMTLVFRVLIITAILAILAFVYVLVEANESENIPRWAISTGRYGWVRYDELPLVKVRSECDGVRTGKCGDLLTDDMGYVVADGFDLWTGRKIEFIRNENGCYFELFQYGLGDDGNPHYDAIYWVECDALNEMLWGEQKEKL